MEIMETMTSVTVGNDAYNEGIGYSFECGDGTKRPHQNNPVIGQHLLKRCAHWSGSPKPRPSLT